jgi:hypothetical protein
MAKPHCNHAPCKQCEQLSLDARKSDYLICCQCFNLIYRSTATHEARGLMFYGSFGL